GDAVRADVTATFHGSKIGLHVNPGKERAGEISVVEIGIPRGAPPPTAAGLISERVVELVPRRARDGSKFESGTVVVVGGSRGLTGAPTMAALSAQRAGAGYVQVAVPSPPAGELARLLDSDSSEVAAHRLACARAAAEQSGCVVVLKGDDSVVAAPGGPLAISPGATPALATAGTGDVLSGMIGAFMAKGLGALEAAAAGVLAHARAGRVAARRYGADHVIAGDVIEAIPEAM